MNIEKDNIMEFEKNPRSNTEVGENNFDLYDFGFKFEGSEYNQPTDMFYDSIQYVLREHVQLVAQQHVGQGQNFDIANFRDRLKNLPQLTEESFTREVDSYQIAVPNGDCSIHLLVQRPPNFHNRKQPAGTILRAVLMDGGNSGGSGVKACAKIIERAIRIIRSHYDSPNMPKDVIEFDSWVVTHWDGDHWGGALHMLENSPIGNRAQTTQYFKYDNDWNPLTTLYCPNWTKPAMFLTEAGLKPANGTHIKQRPKNLCIADEEAVEDTGKGVVYLSSKLGQPLRGFCRAKWGHRQLLGVDYFTGDICYTPSLISANRDRSFDVALNKTLSSFFLLQEFMARIYLERYDHPRFFCLGAAGFVLGGDLSQSAILQAFGLERSSPSDTWANFSSLMSVLHFPQQPHVSLYWAGDAVSAMEMNFVADRTHTQGHFFNKFQFRVAKWSHHGSRHSSPLALWQRLQPQRFVVSPNKNGTYTHPHPNIIKQLHQYSGATKTLFSTFYPGWFKKPKAYVNLAMSDKVREEQKLRNRALAEGEACDFLPEIIETVRDLGKVWGEICYAQANNITGPAYYIRPDGQTVECDHIVPDPGDTYQNLFIHIRSSHDINRDGFMRYYADVRRLSEQEQQDEMFFKSVHEQGDKIIFNIYDYIPNFDLLNFDGMNLNGINHTLKQNFQPKEETTLYQTVLESEFGTAQQEGTPFNEHDQNWDPRVEDTGPYLEQEGTPSNEHNQDWDPRVKITGPYLEQEGVGQQEEEEIMMEKPKTIDEETPHQINPSMVGNFGLFRGNNSMFNQRRYYIGYLITQTVDVK
ncbi:unnamed protein product [Clonostachys rosea]|uniref:Metallo-beta-lactamase domain-containing protein n=1 Tax=Bionectria ochroleuca TaxID=29856 RepID=A0ABY6UMX7_BIOOC|nr:unnamed protein product [Clonostachys rosea]